MNDAAQRPTPDEVPPPASPLTVAPEPPDVYFHHPVQLIPAADGWFAVMKVGDPLPIVAWASADLHAMNSKGVARPVKNGEVSERALVGIVVDDDELFPAEDDPNFVRYLKSPR